MATIENLIPTNQKTAEEALKVQSAGGKRSGEVRREKARMQKLVQYVLDGTYTDSEGNKLTGAELAVQSIFRNLIDYNSRNWGAALSALIKLTDNDTTAEQKARTNYTIARTRQITDKDTTAVDTLNQILDGIRQAAREDTPA